MVLVRGPAATASVINAISRHERLGERVTRVVISPRLHDVLVDEAWEFAQSDIVNVIKFMEIPVEVSPQLTGLDFSMDVIREHPHNDA